MKHGKALGRLIVWNWHMIRKPFALLCGVLAGAELVVLLILAANNRMAMPFNSLFFGGLLFALFALAFMAALGICVRPVVEGTAKTKGGYTLLTLPVPRSVILLAHVLTVALALVLLIALQILLAAVYYWPATAVSQMAIARAGAEGVSLMGPGLFYRSFLNNPLLRLLLPATWQGAGALLLLIAGPAVLLPCAFYHKGASLFGGICLGLVGAPCCVAVIMTMVVDLAAPMGAGAPLILLAVMAVSWLWALRDIRRAAFV